MTKMRTRIGSIVLAVAMLLTLLPVTAFADGTDQTVSPVQVDSFEKLQNAQTAVEGSIIEVSGNHSGQFAATPRCGDGLRL